MGKLGGNSPVPGKSVGTHLSLSLSLSRSCLIPALLQPPAMDPGSSAQQPHPNSHPKSREKTPRAPWEEPVSLCCVSTSLPRIPLPIPDRIPVPLLTKPIPNPGDLGSGITSSPGGASWPVPRDGSLPSSHPCGIQFPLPPQIPLTPNPGVQQPLGMLPRQQKDSQAPPRARPG